MREHIAPLEAPLATLTRVAEEVFGLSAAGTAPGKLLDALAGRRPGHDAAVDRLRLALAAPPAWQDRSVTPPAAPIWATNDRQVWLLNWNGKPIPADAFEIKRWALVAAHPPLPTVTAEQAA